jgi:hypothetical protein
VVGRDSESVARKRWSDLSPGARRFVLVGGAFEAVLKAAALTDLARRSAHQVRGSRSRWAAAMVLVNSLGAVPVLYFVYGRRRH